MLARLRLDQTKKYEQCIAAFEIAAMLTAFIDSKKHILSIGAEQGDINGWDDFILEDSITEFTHLQVKRQNTDFSPSCGCQMQVGQRKTPLDNSMQFLSEWITKNDSSASPITHNFRLELPGDGFNIKKEIQLRQFRDFLKMYIKSTTTIQGLTDLQNVKKDSNAINIFTWLHSWCGFNDWEHILKALRLLEIRDNGSDTDIDTKTKEKLSSVFTKTDDVLQLIKSYVDENSSYTGNIAPRQLLFKLKEYLSPNQRTWSQLDNIGNIWQISGIHDLESNIEIERPSKIISQLWSNDHIRNLNINIVQVSNSLGPIHEGIFQLAIHLQGNVNASCVNWDGWKICLESKLGGTLGEKEDDMDNLTISSNYAPYDITDGRLITSNAEQETFAKAMVIEMTKVTWEMVKEKVSWRISKMNIEKSQELRDAVEVSWNKWQAELGNDESLLKALLKKIMHPNAEGEDILGHLRIGPKTKSLIADALFISLLLSVALDPKNSGIMKTEDGLSIGAIGLRWWSGPAGKPRRVRRIDEEESVKDLIGKEPYDILVLSQSERSESEVYKLPLSESINIDNSIAGGRTPKLLVTRNRLFNSIINRGSIDELREYLQQKLLSQKESLTETLNNNAS